MNVPPCPNPKCGATIDPETGNVYHEPDKRRCWKCGTRRCRFCEHDTGSILIATCTTCEATPEPPDPQPAPTPKPRRKRRE